jgi:glycosidase
MPWTSDPDRGFSPAQPWLPHGPLPPHGAAADQGETSHLARWRSLLAVWRAHRSALPATVQSGHDGDLVLVARGPVVAAVNTGAVPRRLPEPELSLLWRSGAAQDGGTDDEVVRPGEAV